MERTLQDKLGHCSAKMIPINRNTQDPRRTSQPYYTRVFLTDGTDNMKLDIFNFLKPLYVSVMCYGLVWKYPNGKYGLITLQCTAVLVLAWTLAIKCLFHYDSSDTYGGNLFKKLVIHLWAIQIACGLTTFVYCKHKYIPDFINQWQKYKDMYGGVSWRILGRYTYSTVVTVNVLLFVSFTLTFVLLITFMPDFFITMINPNIKQNIDDVSYPTIIVMTTLYTYIILAWMQTGLFTCVFCYLLRREFKQITGKFTRVVQDTCYHDLTTPLQNGNHHTSSAFDQQHFLDARLAQSTSTSNFDCDHIGVETYRKRHLELSILCTKLDSILSTYMLFVYLLDIPIICFTIFGFFDQNGYSGDLVNSLTGISGLVMIMSILLAVTMCGASLASSAREIASVLHSVDLTLCSPIDIASIQMFLEKVTRDHIGLTIWKVVHINKGLIVTVFTVIVSYLALLVRFGLAFNPPASAIKLPSDSQNCTCDVKT